MLKKALSNLLVQNSIVLLASRMTLPVASFFVTILIATRLGAHELGLFSIAMGVYAIFQFISILGYDNIIVRDIAKDTSLSGKIIKEGVVLGLFSTVVCTSGMLLVSRLLGYEGDVVSSIYLASLILFPAYLNTLGENLFIGLKKNKALFQIFVIRELSWLALSAVGLTLTRHINSVISAYMLSRIIAAAAFFYYSKKEKISWEASSSHLESFKQVFATIPTFFMINLLTNLIMEMDIIILSRMVSPSEVGIYSVAKKVFRFSFMTVFCVISTMFPLIVEAVNRSQKEIIHCFKLFSFQIALLSLSIGVFFFICAKPLIQIFFGTSFLPASLIIKILMLKIIPLSLSFLWSRFLISGHRQKEDVFALALGFVVFLFLSPMLIHHHGIAGMAMADAATMTVLAVLHFYFTKTRML